MLLAGKQVSKQLLLFRFWDILAAFEAYFDESGTHDGSTATVVGGALGEVSLWQSLTDQWGDILVRYGVSMFHATDLSNFQGEFEGWDETRRRRFTNDLLKTITDRKLVGLGIGVDNRIFDKVKLDYSDINLDAYQFCCEWCMTWTSGHMRKVNPSKTVAMVFEAGRKFSTPTMDYALNLIASGSNNERSGVAAVDSITIARKIDIIPLQAADLIAYELYKHRSRGAMKGATKIRYPLMVIFEETPMFVGGIPGERHIRDYFEVTRNFIKRRKT